MPIFSIYCSERKNSIFGSKIDLLSHYNTILEYTSWIQLSIKFHVYAIMNSNYRSLVLRVRNYKVQFLMLQYAIMKNNYRNQVVQLRNYEEQL